MATGAMSEYFCKDLLTNPSTRGVTDVSHTISAVSSSNEPSKAAAFLSRIDHPAPSTVKTYGSYQALVDNPAVDIVYIATPHSHHFQNAMLALTAGKHVLCEKALCVTAAQARCLVRTAKDRKLFFMEGVWTRFFPLSRRICELVSEGEIGTVYRVSADVSRANGDGDDVTGKRLNYEDGHRMVSPELAGGVLLGLGVYALTWVFQILYHLQPEAEKEAPEVKAVVQEYHTGIDESVAMLLNFPRHGTVGIATTSLRVATDPGEMGNPAVRIQGSKGEIQVAHPAYKPASFKIIKRGDGGESLEEVVECPQPQDGERGWGNGTFWEADENEALVIAAAFSYEALPDEKAYIRLLEVQELDTTAVYGVRCQLTAWPLEHAPGFHAISYTWGDPEQTTFIHVNGKLLKVRRNCEYALKQARCHGGTRFHWVDAICINQSDHQEKSHQVQMMGRIFKKADLVLACVGPAADDTLFLWSMMWKYRGHAAGSQSYIFHSFTLLQKVTWELLEWKGSVSYSDLKRLLASYRDFIQRPYFSRVWIAQELLLARHVILCCGMDFQPFENLFTITRLLDNSWMCFASLRSGSAAGLWSSHAAAKLRKVDMLRNTSLHFRFSYRNPFYHLANSFGKLPLLRRFSIRKFRWFRVRELVTGRHDHPFELHKAISLMQELECQDLRDRVYGIISLVDWEGREPIFPDYTASVFQLAVKVVAKYAELRSLHLGSQELANSETSVLSQVQHLLEILGLTAEAEDVQRAIKLRQRPLILPMGPCQESCIPERYKDHSWFGWQLTSANYVKPAESNENIVRDVTKEFLPDLGLVQLRTPKNKNGDYTQVVLPATIKPGDWIILAGEFGRSYHDECLILEENVGQFAIIGWGLRDIKSLSSQQQFSYTFGSITEHFEVRFDPEDLVTLVAQRDLNYSNRNKSVPPTSQLAQLSKSLATRVCKEQWSSYAVKTAV
ncbi:D-xylose 1-dehydrogenase [Colletotrichum siamense]|uniref:D-xylose 1-dehydrogenase (NADP(+), D-xylono-1,5-lactone-forming) n=1 Tax=Colletotrichum siamense TaxID=690259 RepID=A0A9P5F372_COLSI|nr:D-xylose 1-dehydrogenase [Colletotrichum siamense]KAF4866879.1 D-xylose 1-dehydrogenase [Colletotrichum siamense]